MLARLSMNLWNICRAFFRWNYNRQSLFGMFWHLISNVLTLLGWASLRLMSMNEVYYFFRVISIMQPLAYHRCESTDVCAEKTDIRSTRDFFLGCLHSLPWALDRLHSAEFFKIYHCKYAVDFTWIYFKESQVTLMLNRVVKFADQVADYRIQTKCH